MREKNALSPAGLFYDVDAPEYKVLHEHIRQGWSPLRIWVSTQFNSAEIRAVLSQYPDRWKQWITYSPSHVKGRVCVFENLTGRSYKLPELGKVGKVPRIEG